MCCRRKKSGVSVTYEVEASTEASASAAGPNREAAPPAAAVNSRGSPGLLCAASMPIARAYSAIPDPTKAQAACIASEPALQANSRSAALTHGVAPIASATMVLLGLTAYGFDSLPTQTARTADG